MGSALQLPRPELRAKALPLREPRKPALSERKKSVRLAAVATLRELSAKWRMSERDFAAIAELAKSSVDGMLDAERPLSVEALLMLPDAHAIEALGALRDLVRDRRRHR